MGCTVSVRAADGARAGPIPDRREKRLVVSSQLHGEPGPSRVDPEVAVARYEAAKRLVETFVADQVDDIDRIRGAEAASLADVAGENPQSREAVLIAARHSSTAHFQTSKSLRFRLRNG
jgi:hypothetical protein